MVVVAVGWQVYSINESALDLAWIGLAEFIPLPLLALPAGQIADRFSRKRVMALSFVLDAVVTGLLLAVTVSGANELWPFLLLAFVSGVSVAVGSPASRALPPTLVSVDLLASAVAYRSIAFQSATIAGPAIGGLLFALKPELVYAVAVAPVRDRRRLPDPDARARRRARAGRHRVGQGAPARRAAAGQAHACAARRDLAGPRRRALRRRDGAAASVREEHPRHGAGRPRNPPQRARGRSVVRRDPARPKADRRQRRPDASDRRRHLRRR